MNKDFYMINAYTANKLEGANIVVVPEAEGLSDTLLQKLAAEFNADQTVFITSAKHESRCPRLRIFTSQHEEPFGGHPTIAAVHLLQELNYFKEDPQDNEQGKITKSVVEENVGYIEVAVQTQEGQPALQQYQRQADYQHESMTPTTHELSEMLSLPESAFTHRDYHPAIILGDKNYLVVPCQSAEQVRKARFNHQPWVTSNAVQYLAKDILLFTDRPENPENDYLCRLLGPEIGPQEDPPVGSSMPAFCGYIHEAKKEAKVKFSVERGNKDTRFSLLHLSSEKGQEGHLSVWSGGHAVIVGKGVLFLD